MRAFEEVLCSVDGQSRLRRWVNVALLAVLTACFLCGTSVPASAQTREVVARLVDYGQMSNEEAARVAARVSEVLRDNASRGGDQYDAVRKKVGQALFGGPGGTRDEYERRLQQVLLRFASGMDAALLEALFVPGRQAALTCVRDFGVNIMDCDALLAASTRQRAALPYTPADDGDALVQAMRASRVGRSEARRIHARLREVMLGVPSNLTRDAAGRALASLMNACPGALSDRESQVRAWHLGPSEGMASCIGGALATMPEAVQKTQIILGVSAADARAFLGWASPRPTRAVASAPSLDDVLAQARQAYGAGQFQQAASLYQRAVDLSPRNARAFAGLGSSLVRAGEHRGAVVAYLRAVELEPKSADLRSRLAEAYASAGQTREADAAYRQALRLDPNHRHAKQGLGRLSTASQPAQPAQPDWLARGHEAFKRGQFDKAAQAYGYAASAQPSAQAFAGLGAAKLRGGDARGAVRAYQNAVQMAPQADAHWTSLGRAQVQAGDPTAAVQSLKRAVAINPNNADAQAGLRALGGSSGASPATSADAAPSAPAAPALPQTPARDDILNAMRPLQSRLAVCAPEYHGTVMFQLVIAGETGQITSAAVQGEMAEMPEAQCMVNVVKEASFPRFTREALEIAYPFKL